MMLVRITKGGFYHHPTEGRKLDEGEVVDAIRIDRFIGNTEFVYLKMSRDPSGIPNLDLCGIQAGDGEAITSSPVRIGPDCTCQGGG